MMRGSPSVQVYTNSDDTFVHIHQLIYSTNSVKATVSETQDCVMMTLMQFRSLMFHLRALDAKFMQRAESSDKWNETRSVGMKRTWSEREGNVVAISTERIL